MITRPVVMGVSMALAAACGVYAVIRLRTQAYRAGQRLRRRLDRVDHSRPGSGSRDTI